MNIGPHPYPMACSLAPPFYPDFCLSLSPNLMVYGMVHLWIYRSFIHDWPFLLNYVNVYTQMLMQNLPHKLRLTWFGGYSNTERIFPNLFYLFLFPFFLLGMHSMVANFMCQLLLGHRCQNKHSGCACEDGYVWLRFMTESVDWVKKVDLPSVSGPHPIS
jgi:hypothetical protein